MLARNAAELTIEALNAGTLPTPYATKGINGTTIEPVIIDEAGGTTKQVTEYRNLVQRQNVDEVIGYISSGDCLAIAPLADELKKLTIFFDCGTPRIFEDASYKYLFRTGAHAAMDNVAAARYLLARKSNVKTVVNQPELRLGARTLNDFKASMQTLTPDVKIVTGAVSETRCRAIWAEISALSRSRTQSIRVSGGATWRR